MRDEKTFRDQETKTHLKTKRYREKVQERHRDTMRQEMERGGAGDREILGGREKK